MATQSETQPAWVCFACGERHRAGQWFEFSTWHMDECGVCHCLTSVTEPRDCGYLKKGWEKDAGRNA